MRYPHVVTFEAPSETRTPSGGVSLTYTADPDLTDLAARVVPVQEDSQIDRMVLERDLYTIIVQGDREVERDMRVVSDYLDASLLVIRVQRPVLYGSAHTYATIVTAENVTATEDES